jgi:hypothetical protein
VTAGSLENHCTRCTAGAVTFRTHKFCFFTSALNGTRGLIFFGGRYFLGIQSIPPPVSLTKLRCLRNDGDPPLPTDPGERMLMEGDADAGRPSLLIWRGGTFSFCDFQEMSAGHLPQMRHSTARPTRACPALTTRNACNAVRSGEDAPPAATQPAATARADKSGDVWCGAGALGAADKIY